MLARHLGTAALFAVFAVSSCNCDETLTAVVDRGDVRGVLCADADGQAAAGITVEITDVNGEPFTATTDATGTFTVTGLVSGIADVKIIDGGVERSGTIVVPVNEIAQFTDAACRAPEEPAPQTGSIDGCICDASVGGYVGGANVYVQTADGGIFPTTTDASGCFTLTGVPVGNQTVNVDKGSFTQTHQVTVSLGTTTTLPAVTCEPPAVPDEAGTVAGRVCAPDGETWLSGAEVYVELADGTRVAVTTDADGRYTLINVPVGRQTVHVVKGSFTSNFQVDVYEDQTTTVPEDECTITPVGLRVAVVTGTYDHVEDVLTSIGVEADHIDIYESFYGGFSNWVDQLLVPAGVLEQYDIVFLNCGLADTKFFGQFRSQQAIDRLRTFVANGGSVYASDWAYNVVEAVWPDFIDFLGDESADAAKNGFAPLDMTATIT
ncbi:MAG TPA: carboxypeptidase-like regulatory domain-containing protein, partial [Myxococcota bacterium]